MLWHLACIFATFSVVLSNPGASWSEEEALIVKAKLYAITNQPQKVSNEYLALHPELGLDTWPEKKSFPSAAKFLRLGFHQCLKFSDGTGGCNGCLNNHGMGLENRHNCTLGERRMDLPDQVSSVSDPIYTIHR